MIFRDATLPDLPTIVAIYNSTVAGRLVTADTEPVSVAGRVGWFHQHKAGSRPLWIVENEEGFVLGWVSFKDFYGRPAYSATAEVSIYLHEDARGKKYGERILEYAIAQCPFLNINTLLGFIFAQNIPSLKLFEKLGFEMWGELKNIAVLDGKECNLRILGKRVTG